VLPRRNPLLGYGTLALGAVVAWALGASTTARFLIVTLAATIVLLFPMAFLAQALFPLQPKLADDFTTLGLSDAVRRRTARRSGADTHTAAPDGKRGTRRD
jgi:hypothetical protein